MRDRNPDHEQRDRDQPVPAGAPEGVALHITVESFDEWDDRTVPQFATLANADWIDNIESDDTLSPQDHILSFTSVEQARRLLPDARLDLLREIMRESPLSISALADRVDREPSAVREDLDVLADQRIIFLDRIDDTDDTRVKPLYDAIYIDTAVHTDRREGRLKITRRSQR